MKPFTRNVISALFILAASLASCKNEDCVSSANNYLLVNFLTLDTLQSGEVGWVAKDTVFYSVTAVGVDSSFCTRNKKLSSLSLPVNPSADQTTFFLEMLDSVRYDTITVSPIDIDTTYFVHKVPHEITVSYERRSRVITETCGIEIGYYNVVADTITFPSSALIENSLSRFNEANIEVYF